MLKNRTFVWICLLISFGFGIWLPLFLNSKKSNTEPKQEQRQCVIEPYGPNGELILIEERVNSKHCSNIDSKHSYCLLGFFEHEEDALAKAKELDCKLSETKTSTATAN